MTNTIDLSLMYFQSALDDLWPYGLVYYSWRRWRLFWGAQLKSEKWLFSAWSRSLKRCSFTFYVCFLRFLCWMVRWQFSSGWILADILVLTKFCDPDKASVCLCVCVIEQHSTEVWVRENTDTQALRDSLQGFCVGVSPHTHFILSGQVLPWGPQRHSAAKYVKGNILPLFIMTHICCGLKECSPFVP